MSSIKIDTLYKQLMAMPDDTFLAAVSALTPEVNAEFFDEKYFPLAKRAALLIKARREEYGTDEEIENASKAQALLQNLPDDITEEEFETTIVKAAALLESKPKIGFN